MKYSTLQKIKGKNIIQAVEENSDETEFYSQEIKKVAKNYEFEIVEKGVSATADVSLATNSIIKDVDCICLVIDNTVSAALPTIIEIATNNKIPVFCNEADEVKLGGIACNGIDYKSLGVETGKIAAQILKGDK